VAVAGRNADKARAAAQSIGFGAEGYSCDVRDYATTRAVMEQVCSAWGPLDIVVSGAAGNFLAPVAGLSPSPNFSNIGGASGREL
jgi:NAD(P)-dependent dehydrogenase (short-subunit alcohol dehydrogenase family)